MILLVELSPFLVIVGCVEIQWEEPDTLRNNAQIFKWTPQNDLLGKKVAKKKKKKKILSSN